MSEEQNGPLVTVFIPSYNHETYVKQSILSVVEQTWKNVELIVVDDGSPDGSVKLLSALSKEYGFSFTAQKNKGLTATLNDALANAKGKYFCMLSSDDIIFPDKLEMQVAFMEGRPDVGLCGGGAIHIDKEGATLSTGKKLGYAELDFDDVYMDKKKGPTAPSMMARTEALRNVGGYDPEIRLEDMDMWLKLSYAGWKIVCLEREFCYYRVHEANTYRNLEFMLDSLLASWSKYSDHPAWPEMRNRFIISTFLKATERNKTLAIKLVPRIPVKAYNMKVIRGMLRLASRW